MDPVQGNASTVRVPVGRDSQSDSGGSNLPPLTGGVVVFNSMHPEKPVADLDLNYLVDDLAAKRRLESIGAGKMKSAEQMAEMNRQRCKAGGECTVPEDDKADLEAWKDLRAALGAEVKSLDSKIAKLELQAAGNPLKPDDAWAVFKSDLRARWAKFANRDSASHAEWSRLAHQHVNLEHELARLQGLAKSSGESGDRSRLDKKVRKVQASLQETDSRISRLADEQRLRTGSSYLGEPR